MLRLAGVVAPLVCVAGSAGGPSSDRVVGWKDVGAGRRMRPVGLLDRLRWADTDDRLGSSGLALAGLVVGLAVEDCFLWGAGFVPVRYRRLVAESGFSRSTVARRLPVVLEMLATLGVVDYWRRVGEPYRVRLLVEVGVLEGWGVSWAPWAVADVSHRLHPRSWSHTDRAAASGWWGFAGWDGHVGGGVGVEGLAARVGLRPSTLSPSRAGGLWASGGDRLEVRGWEDPLLVEHRRRVRYEDYRCSVPSRSGREGASVRWVGHSNIDEPEDAHAGAAGDVDSGGDWETQWGGLIEEALPVTTHAYERSSGARPAGSAGKSLTSHSSGPGTGGGAGSGRCRVRWTPDRYRFEEAIGSVRWLGPDRCWVGGLARRYGWYAAEQAALETDRAVHLGRQVRSARALAAHFARCFARPDTCSGRHRGACGQMRLDLHRGRRLDEHQQTRTTNLTPNPTPDPTPSPDEGLVAGVSVLVAAVAEPGGGGVADPGVSPPTVWPSDPCRSLTEAAVGAPPGVAALAGRLARRFAHTSTINPNPNPNPNGNDNDTERSIPR